MSITDAYDFSALVKAQVQISQALDSYESACNILDLLDFKHGTLPELAIRTFFSSVEDERVLLARQSSRILRLSSKLCEIRNKTTTAVPVARLSPDILSMVFTMAADSTRTALANAQAQTGGLPKIVNVLSSVCSYWRRVALDNPALWTQIDLNRKGGPSHAAL
ncbi:hypothetical protein BDV93DRAFT_609224 [Ceratobasidium sp. AG-I]|nr:hypothetical protein BDV93DRAFT_609224 [Ceratobasidium sp. AG-I]